MLAPIVSISPGHSYHTYAYSLQSHISYWSHWSGALPKCANVTPNHIIFGQQLHLCSMLFCFGFVVLHRKKHLYVWPVNSILQLNTYPVNKDMNKFYYMSHDDWSHLAAICPTCHARLVGATLPYLFCQFKGPLVVVGWKLLLIVLSLHHF